MTFINHRKSEGAAASGGVFLLLLCIQLILNQIFLVDPPSHSGFSLLLLNLLPLLQLNFFLLFMLGYVKLGKFRKIPLMVVSVYALLAYQFGYYTLNLSFDLINQGVFGLSFPVLFSVIFGLLNLFFGTSILSTYRGSSSLGTLTGFCTVLVGVIFLTTSFVEIASILLFPTYALQILLLWRASPSLAKTL